ncbi:hypothetical protein BDZ89DRAFT_1079793 [Hymenopellis radicata]|nr:hypothetical protein BDZ89DRAFT_1079793 [Hymenopellis radicata]
MLEAFRALWQGYQFYRAECLPFWIICLWIPLSTPNITNSQEGAAHSASLANERMAAHSAVHTVIDGRVLLVKESIVAEATSIHLHDVDDTESLSTDSLNLLAAR